MALHGMNMPLAFAGQEFIRVEVYKELGIEFEALLDFFNGPAFLSWSRMGNIQGHGGPIPYSYIRGQAGTPCPYSMQIKISDQICRRKS